jgi:hypothetical protein
LTFRCMPSQWFRVVVHRTISANILTFRCMPSQWFRVVVHRTISANILTFRCMPPPWFRVVASWLKARVTWETAGTPQIQEQEVRRPTVGNVSTALSCQYVLCNVNGRVTGQCSMYSYLRRSGTDELAPHSYRVLLHKTAIAYLIVLLMAIALRQY